MSKPSVVILGGGMSGLVAAVAMKGADVTVIEPSTPGGVFTKGGFKYFHRTKMMEYMMSEVEVDWHSVPIRGGILLDGDIKPYPEHLRDLPKPMAMDIMRQHFDKTRGKGEFSPTAMNDPWGDKPDKLITDINELIKSIMAMPHINWVKDAAKVVWHGEVGTANGKRIQYDYLINTLPLWIFGRMPGADGGRGETPSICTRLANHAKANRITIFKCLSSSKRYTKYDYVYTPVTPGDMIHRLSVNNTWFELETAKSIDQMGRVMADIRHLLGESASIIDGATIPGHVIGFDRCQEDIAKLPDHWRMVGRFAQWDSRCTTDKAFAHAYEWRKQIGLS